MSHRHSLRAGLDQWCEEWLSSTLTKRLTHHVHNERCVFAKAAE